MINQEKFRKEYDNICLSDAEKKELTDSVISGKRKKRRLFSRVPLTIAACAAAVILILGIGNIVTYTYAQDSLFHVISMAAKGIASSGMFGEKSDTEYLSSELNEVDHTIVYKNYEISIIDYLYDDPMDVMYFSVRVRSHDKTAINLSDEHLIHLQDYIYNCFTIGTFSEDVTLFLLNEDTPDSQGILMRHETRPDGLYFYVECDEVKDGLISLCITDKDEMNLEEVKKIYTFELDENMENRYCNIEYDNINVALSPFQIKFTTSVKDPGITDMTIHYKDGSDFAVISDKITAGTNGSSISTSGNFVTYVIKIENVRALSDIDYIDIDGKHYVME